MEPPPSFRTEFARACYAAGRLIAEPPPSFSYEDVMLLTKAAAALVQDEECARACFEAGRLLAEPLPSFRYEDVMLLTQAAVSIHGVEVHHS